jgi:hypothetical protein
MTTDRRWRLPAPARRDVFMNHAFGRPSEYLYLSLIAGITSVGMTPRSVVELSGDARLELTFDLISRCA